MRLLGRLIGAVIAFSLTASIAAAVAAVRLKSRHESRGGPADDEIEVVAIFESRDLTSSATSFRRADVTAIYGGGTLDLRLATLAPDGATVSAWTIFGGYRLAVPGTWRVELGGFGVFGGFGDARNRAWVDQNGPVLRVRGFALFGGLGIVSETPDLGPPRPQTFAMDDEDGFHADNRGLVTDIEQVPPAPASV
jgi:hypothetical protein